MPQQKNDLTRRKFLGRTVAGLAATGLATMAPISAIAQVEGKPEAKKEIIHRTLGRTGLNIPIVSMGVMNSNNPGVVQASYEMGVRHFDTAAAYQMGRNEQMVGAVINRLKARDKVVIGTKSYSPDQRRGGEPKEVIAEIIKLCDGSLSRLKTDYIDIFYIHSVDNVKTVQNKVVQEALSKLKEQKKIRFCGVSTHSNMAEVINAVAADGFFDVVLTGINFTQADDKVLLDAVKNAADKGVGMVGMKTFAGGSRWPDPESRSKYNNKVINSAAHKWVLSRTAIHTTIPGYDNFDHMKEDFAAAMDLEFTDEERSFLADNNVHLSMGYCRQCRKCLATCPNDVDVPTLMRTHMYAAQYGNLAHARMTYDGIASGRKLDACVSCDECTARCNNTVDISRRIDELKMIYA